MMTTETTERIDYVALVADVFDFATENPVTDRKDIIDVYRVAENRDGEPEMYVTSVRRDGLSIELPNGRVVERSDVNRSQIAAMYRYLWEQKEELSHLNPAEQYNVRKRMRAAQALRGKAATRLENPRLSASDAERSSTENGSPKQPE